MFVDEVQVHLQAGHGGRGCLAFRREKRVPRGGPSGGDGGHGGSIYLVANPHTSTLINYRFHPEFDAEKGQHGQGSNRTGHDGKDLELSVPLGTLIYEKSEDPSEPYRLVADLAHKGDRIMIAKGGRGGMGNARFATATNRAPRKVQPGEPGEEKFLRLELKLLADVGLVGFPNAGKSTLISRISAARPKIADYPFTTLTPNLGVVGLSGERSFVVADVPGLIEGAHRGLGLGHQFLRHLERTKVLVHLVDLSSLTTRDPVEDLNVLRRELELFAPTLAAKPQIVAANKIDALDDEERAAGLERRAGELELPFYRISAVSGAGLPELLEEMWRQVAAARAVEAAEIEIDRNAGEVSSDRTGMGSDRIPDDLSERRNEATSDAAADETSHEHPDGHIPTR
jgi:GTP-binding protein